ncbi:cell wall-binding repeat-containing protein [Peptoniphilus gorbachii]|uniref:Endonuclease YncB(Thermonuclease family)/putative cell wall-binding protein n=1 Tax=Peptoniphilus gorbachii TaxID=411567 RepID=A0ABS2MHV1_9FIRM|nr:cell wall-binding repeat-containing protein [Peptoniphilus gorbachii]MBM7549602.1 endonuclease YncB(thermonuclease family)/putative cell wall-binding protein [Peptoniphilus gorbachii]
MFKKRVMSLLLAGTLIFTPLSTTFAQQEGKDVNVSRISGKNRYETALEISRKSFTSSDYAVVASGEDFPDALAGGQLAIQQNAPILLVSKTGVSSTVSSEIKRLGVKHIYLLGGTSLISKSIEKELKSQVKTVERLAGKNRYETANEIFKAVLKNNLNGQTKEQVSSETWKVDGTNFPDALTAAPFIGKLNTNRNENLDIVFLGLQPKDVVLKGENAIGGKSSVKGNALKRLAGTNRYETATLIAKEYTSQVGGSVDTVYLANGLSYPDALASAPAVAKNNSVLLLTESGKLSQATKTYLESAGIKNVVILGGESSVSANVVKQIKGEEKPKENPKDVLYPVTRVVDGDTIVVNINGKDEKVRLIGVDTPESVHPDKNRNTEFGKVASNFTKNLLKGKSVKLEFDVQQRDKYGRLLAYVYIEGKMVNKELLIAGMAKVATFPPNVKYVEKFRALEKTARDAKVGIWEDSSPLETPNPDQGKNPGKKNPNKPGGYKNPNDPAYLYAKGRIIGNKNSMIFHLPGNQGYKKVAMRNAVFFNTIAEAKAAGFRQAKR